jgi:predicted DNA-binding transcriptional regulator AlpA
MATHLRRAAIATDARVAVDADTLVDAAELRRMCGGISDMTARRWIARGILPEPRHIERRRFWRRAEVLAALDAHQEAPPASPAPDGPAARTRRADAP